MRRGMSAADTRKARNKLSIYRVEHVEMMTENKNNMAEYRNTCLNLHYSHVHLENASLYENLRRRIALQPHEINRS